MKTVELNYWVTFGKCDSTDRIPWEVELTDEEEKIYDNAIANKLSLNEIPELQGALDRAYSEIEEESIEIGLDDGDEFVMECQGVAPMDCDELNELVAKRDPHALEFFGLQDATDEELEEWDAYDLDDDDIPLIKDFQEDFEPESPYAVGWDLNVEFVDPND